MYIIKGKSMASNLLVICSFLTFVFNSKARAIGVSNFEENHLRDILELHSLIPSVNQVSMKIFLNCFFFLLCFFCEGGISSLLGGV